MVIHLSGPPGDCPEGRTSSPCPTLGLAPGGVYRADRIAPAAGALLPHRFTLTCAGRSPPSAVSSLWHFPAGRPDWPLTSTLPYGVPTFLDPVPQSGPGRDHPADSPSLQVSHRRAKAWIHRLAIVAPVSGVSQQSFLDPREDAISISALYDQVEVALARVFPKRRSIWVRGEIQSITDRTGHCYIDLIDPDGVRDRQSPVLKVKCWRTSWEPMSTSLGRQGIVLEAGMVVVIRGTLDFYKPRAELGFLLAEVDVAAILGRLAQKRAALLELLKREGLLDLNKRLRVPEVPLRVGLVASSGTEGHGDFVGQLERSQYTFDIVLARASVQGSQAAQSIAGTLVALSQRNCDIVVVVRGGGSKADLATFDTEPVARAIATMPVPVWVGIGHTGDQSVADIVANRSFVTPTDCAKELVGRLGLWWESIASRALVIERRVFETLTDAAYRDDRAEASARAVFASAAAATFAETHRSSRSSRSSGPTTGRGCRCAPRFTGGPCRETLHAGTGARIGEHRRLSSSSSGLRHRPPTRSRILAQLRKLGSTGPVGSRSRTGGGDDHSTLGRHSAFDGAGGRDEDADCGVADGRRRVTNEPSGSGNDDPGVQIPVAELSYTDASRELDSIVEFFEHRDVDVDLLVPRLERATAIVDELDRRVRRTRAEVEQLVPRLQAATRSSGDGSGEAVEDNDEE